MAKRLSESLIRKMTRLAVKHNAVNLSQGFPNEGPPFEAILAATNALIGGRPDRLNILDTPLQNVMKGRDPAHLTVADCLKEIYTPHIDVLNQYNIPFGLQSLRKEVAKFYRRFYDWDIHPEKQITICLGATEAFASALRTLCNKGDKVLIIEPFHEIYPSQAEIFYIDTEFTALQEKNGAWHLDFEDFERQALKCKAVLLNTPHNPTGHVFTYEELKRICNFCAQHNIYIITDEIYEFMIFSKEKKHIILPQAFPEVQDLCIVVSSISKTCSATGWRVGWAIHPECHTSKMRGVHDQMVLQAVTPIQIGVQGYLRLPDTFFLHEVPKKYRKRRDVLVPALQKIGFEIDAMPEAAYYVFCRYRKVPKLANMTPMEAAMFLVETVKVATVPGDNFYNRFRETYGQEYIRFCFVRQEDELHKAIQRLEAHLL